MTCKITIEINGKFGASINVDDKALSSVLSNELTRIIEKQLGDKLVL